MRELKFGVRWQGHRFEIPRVRKPWLRHLFASCILHFAFALLAAAQQPPTLATKIETATAALPHAVWAIDIEDDDGNVLYAENAHLLMIPASTRKLFNAVSVVNCFGFDHQFTTELWRDGIDVIIRGGGDPSLGGRWAFNRDAVFAPFVEALRKRGVDTVGDVYADVSAFDRNTIPGSWKTGNLGSDYAAPVDALAYNENVVGVVVDHCASPVVTTDPFFVPATANTICGQGAPIIRTDAANAVAVYGAIPDHVADLVAVTDPALYAAQALREALRHAGIRVIGAVGVVSMPRTWRERIAVIESPPLWQLLSVVLKPSQNLYAEMLFKNLSGSYAASAAIERRILTEIIGLDPAEFRFLDGSGLSPDDLVTAAATVKVLRWMNAPSRRGAWSTLLAVPGDQEGTLRRRFPELALRVRGKTGSIAGVNALAAIVQGRDGCFRYVSLIVNHHTGEGAEALNAFEAIVREVASLECGGKATALQSERDPKTVAPNRIDHRLR